MLCTPKRIQFPLTKYAFQGSPNLLRTANQRHYQSWESHTCEDGQSPARSDRHRRALKTGFLTCIFFRYAPLYAIKAGLLPTNIFQRRKIIPHVVFLLVLLFVPQFAQVL